MTCAKVHRSHRWADQGGQNSSSDRCREMRVLLKVYIGEQSLGQVVKDAANSLDIRG